MGWDVKHVGDSPHSITITEAFDSLSLRLGGLDNFSASVPEHPEPSEINNDFELKISKPLDIKKIHSIFYIINCIYTARVKKMFPISFNTTLFCFTTECTIWNHNVGQ